MCLTNGQTNRWNFSSLLEQKDEVYRFFLIVVVIGTMLGEYSTAANSSEYTYTNGEVNTGLLVPPSVLIVNGSDIATQAGAISGSEDVIKSGSGTLIFTGSNNYGGTTITGGELLLPQAVIIFTLARSKE